MRRVPLRRGSSGTANSGVIVVPPPGGSGPCACSGLTVAWSTGGSSASAIKTDDVLPVLVADGHICADTEWELDASWSPEDGGAAPVLTQAGANAWSVSASAAGVLVVGVTAVCGGSRISAGSATLTIIDGAVYSGGTAQWVDISTLPITMEAIGSPSMSYAGGMFTDSQLQQVVPGDVGYAVSGLDAAVGAVYARLRVRIADFDATASPYDGVACGVFIAGGTSVSDYAEIIGPVELSTLVVEGGADSSGDQIGSFTFAVDVEVYQP